MKKLMTSARKGTALILVAVTMLMAAGRSNVFAMVAPDIGLQTQRLMSPDRVENIEKVQAFLHQKMVRQRLADYGLSDQEINVRLNRLNDEELKQVALQLDQQDPGGDGGGIIITALVIGILVLLFIHLARRV